MGWRASIGLIWQAAADAELADGIHRSKAFRAALQEDRDAAIRVFRVTTLPPADGRVRRDIPASWRFRLDPARVRPLL